MAVEVVDVAETGRGVGAVQLQRHRTVHNDVGHGITAHPGKLDLRREGRFDVPERIVSHLQIFHFRVYVTETQPDVRILHRVGDQLRLETPVFGIGIEHRAGGADELEGLVVVVVVIVRGNVETGLAAEQGGFETGLV